MRKKRPCITTLDEVRIKREGEHAVIEYNDSTISTVHLKIGEKIRDMTEQQILDLHNEVLRAQQKLAAEHVYFAAEIPEGHPQIRYFEPGDQWVPRGDVLRCVVSDGGEDGEATVYIDDHELSLREFGRLLCTHAGWGMRITFVPEDELCEEPTTHVRDVPDED